MSRSTRGSSLLFLMLGAALLVLDTARAADRVDPLAPLRFLLGSWEGGSDAAVVTHTYELVLQDRFIQSRTRAEETNPRGEATAEVHEDVGFFSYDQDRDQIVLRQFLSEGYVNTYSLTAQDASNDSLVFTSSSTEGAGGMRARLTIHRTAPDAYEMRLDLAAPGKEFFTCQHLVMRRVEAP